LDATRVKPLNVIRNKSQYVSFELYWSVCKDNSKRFSGGRTGAKVGVTASNLTTNDIIPEEDVMLLIEIPVLLITPPWYALVLGYSTPVLVPDEEIPLTPTPENKSVVSP